MNQQAQFLQRSMRQAENAIGELLMQRDAAMTAMEIVGSVGCAFTFDLGRGLDAGALYHEANEGMKALEREERKGQRAADGKLIVAP